MKKLVTLLTSILATLIFIIAVSIAVINMTSTKTLNVQTNQVALVSVGLATSIVAIILSAVNKKTLCVLIPVIAIVILGIYATNRVFRNTDEFALLSAVLILLVGAGTALGEIKKEYYYASIVAAVSASVLFVFYLFEALPIMFNFNNPFMSFTTFGICVLYAYVIALNGLNIVKTNSLAKEEVKADTTETKVEDTEVSEEASVEAEKTPVEAEEAQVEATETLETQNNSETVSQEIKEENKEEAPYDNSSLINE